MKDLIDKNGNVIPPPDSETDVAKMIYLLEYCRHRNFVVGPIVQVGDVVLQVKDPTLERAPTEKKAEVTIWEQHGHKDEGDE